MVNKNITNSSLRILVCYYQDLLVKLNNNTYFNLHCGKDDTNFELEMIADNTGDNISIRNRYWSEITGLYWAWKNLDKIDYVGLCSYRRFFNFKINPRNLLQILPLDSSDQINEIEIPNMEEVFLNYDIIIPKPYVYAYSIREVCKRNYRIEDFDILEKIINKISPEFDEAFISTFYNNNKLIGHNMFIMSWEHYNEFCEWVFSILFEAEKQINPLEYPIQQVRVFGYMHELLLQVFINKKKFRSCNSQITWLNNENKSSRFDNIFYKLACEFMFFFRIPVAKLLK
jgi:hypothetical protein